MRSVSKLQNYLYQIQLLGCHVRSISSSSKQSQSSISKSKRKVVEIISMEDLYHRVVQSLLKADEEHGLSYGQGTLDAYEDAQLLLTHTLNLPATQPFEQFYYDIMKDDIIADVRRKVQIRIQSRKPMAYIIGAAYQQGEVFDVDERVLIPRSFLGEILCNRKLWSFNNKKVIRPKESIKSVLDLCTGCGSLAILASKVFKQAEIIDATDISKDALDVALKNLVRHNMMDRIRLYHGDLFEALNHPYHIPSNPPTDTNASETAAAAPVAVASISKTFNSHEGHQTKKYDLILCNPPYVDDRAMTQLPQEYNYEPKLALAAKKNGIEIIERVLAQSKDYLNEDGVLLCEIGLCAPELMRRHGDIFTRRQHKLHQGNLIVEDASKARWIETMTTSEEVFAISKEVLMKSSKL